MKHLVVLTFILPFVLNSCCSQQHVEKKETMNNQQIKPPAQITMNKSVAVCELQEVLKGENGFVVRAKVLSIEEDGAYPNMAEVGATYLLSPVVYESENEDASLEERNKKIRSVAGLKKGDKFKAVISYEGTKGWFIQDLIN